MKFENLIYHHQDLQGETLKEVRMYGGELVLTTESNRFAILIPKIDEEDEDGYDSEYVRVLGPSEVFWKLKEHTPIRNFLKGARVIDFEEFERLLKEEYAENERKRKLQQVEQEKRLYAELKAKYEAGE